MSAILKEIALVHVFYALLSLTIVRRLPAMISLFKSGIDTTEKVFIGWFGPRGLASNVFVVMIMDKDLPNQNLLVLVVVLTILLSVVAHGLSANPYARCNHHPSGRQPGSHEETSIHLFVFGCA